MASPIMTDEELAEESKVVAKKEENKGLKETMKEMASEGESVIKKELVEETERELKESHLSCILGVTPRRTPLT